jgi:hypothetical protein
MGIATNKPSRTFLLVFLAVLVTTGAPSPAAGQWLKKRYDPCLDLLRTLTGPVSSELVRPMRYELQWSKCQGIVPLLRDWYQSNQVLYRDEILDLLTHFWVGSSPNPDGNIEFSQVRPIYLELVKDALLRPGLAEQGARLAQEWGVSKELQPELVALLKRATEPKAAHYAAAFPHALQALVAAGATDPSSLPDGVLLALLQGSLNVQGLGANLSGQRIRELRMETARVAGRLLAQRKSTEAEVIKGLITLLFTESMIGSNAEGGLESHAVFEALLEIGPAAVPFLVDVLTAKPADQRVRYLAEFARSRYRVQWKDLRRGHVSRLLGLIGESSAAKALLQDLGQPIAPPADARSFGARNDWTLAQVGRIQANAEALMSLFHPSVAMDALTVLRDSRLDSEIRLQTAQALAFVHTPQARVTLFRAILDDGPTRDATQQGDLPPPARETEFITNLLYPLALATGYDGLSNFEDTFHGSLRANFGEHARLDDIRDRLARSDIQVLIQVSKTCQKQPDCYLQVFLGNKGLVKGNPETFDPNAIKEEDPSATEYIRMLARTKAALVLGRGDTGGERLGQILSAFASAYSDLPFEQEKRERYSRSEPEEPGPGEWGPQVDDLRNAIVLGLERMGRQHPAVTLPILRNILKYHETKLPSAAIWKLRLEALVLLLERN